MPSRSGPIAKPPLEDATSCQNAEAPQQFGPGDKDVQPPQERCQIVDRVMERTTHVHKSPRYLSHPVDLKPSTKWCTPLDA